MGSFISEIDAKQKKMLRGTLSHFKATCSLYDKMCEGSTKMLVIMGSCAIRDWVDTNFNLTVPSIT